jgi:acetoacetate decarboxylase
MPNTGESAYSMPTMAPSYPEGPYEYDEFTVLTLAFEMEPAVADRLVPGPLDPLAPPVCHLSFYDYGQVTGFGAYNEFAVSIPTTYEGEVRSFSPYFVLDGDDPLTAGREVWGIPKKHGAIAVDTDGGLPHASVERDGVELASASVDPERETDDHPLTGETAESIYHKRIPSASAGEPPVVDRLVTAHVRDIEVNRAVTGPGYVSVSGSASDPIGVLEPTGDVTGYMTRVEWVLETAEDAVLHDFREADAEAEASASRPP